MHLCSKQRNFNVPGGGRGYIPDIAAVAVPPLAIHARFHFSNIPMCGMLGAGVTQWPSMLLQFW